MNVVELTGLISESAARLATAAGVSRRDEKWWAFIAKEDWNLIRLSWELRGVILRRGKGTEATSGLDNKARKQIEEIIKGVDLEHRPDSD